MNTLDELKEKGLWTEGQKLKLHLGCGEAHFDGYVNVDYPSSSHSVMTVRPDFEADITRMSFPTGSVSEIRLHHVFEHLNRAVALASIIRWHDWLEIGGVLHIETPDFEASALAFARAPTLQEKMRAIRHLEGDQADGWAYHIGQWFPARFEKTFRALGFGTVEVRREQSCHTPPLYNVSAIGNKTERRVREEQYAAGCALLQDTMVADAERPTWEVWTRQLAAALDFTRFPTPEIAHPAPLPVSAGYASQAIKPGRPIVYRADPMSESPHPLWLGGGLPERSAMPRIVLPSRSG